MKEIALLGDQAEKTRNQFAQLYGSMAAGDAALASLKKFASDNGLALDATQAAAAKLKNFGLDPLKGSLQALVDQNAAAGGSMDDLNGKILAVGQAWAKQKLQGEEILQLVERGVPVWDALQKSTGKNVAELQKLSEAGKLGRKEITGLLAEIGKMNSGSAVKNAGTLSGLFEQLSGRVREFFTTVANSGTLDYFKAQLTALNKYMSDMAASGQLATLARSVSDGIVATGQAVAGVVGFVKEYGETILTLARAYLVFKGASYLTSFAKSTMAYFDGMSASAAGATGRFAQFKAAAGNIAKGAQFALLAAAVDYTVGQITELVEVTEEYYDVQKKLKELQTETIDVQKRLAASIAAAAAHGNDALKVQLKGAEELSKATRSQLNFYIQSLQRAAEEARRVKAEARLRGDEFGVGNMEATLVELNKALADAQSALGKLGTVAQQTGDFARKVASDFGLAAEAGRSAFAALDGVFEKLDLTTPQGIKDLVETLQVVGPRSKEARAAIEGELVVALQKLSGEELRLFQLRAAKAFQAAGGNAKDLAAVMNGALGAAMAKLGVDAGKAGVAFTESGRDMIATFKAVTENAKATSAQITAAFNEALGKATTKEEAEALGAAIKSAGQQGKVGIDQAKDAANALALRLREIAVEVDPLADQFARFGVKSKAELDATRDSAERFYLSVAEGARKGRYAQDDLRAAFMAYADAARAAVANGTASAKQQVETQLKVKAVTLGVSDALKAMGDSGEAAGKRTAAAADDAADSLGKLGDSAEKAADSAADLGDGADSAAAGLDKVAAAGQQAASVTLNLSKAFADAATGAHGLERITFTLAEEQQRQADGLLEQLRQQNAAYDPLEQRLQNLRNQFKLLGDDQLRALAQEQEKLDQNLQRRQEALDAQRQQQREQQSGGSGAGGVTRIEVVHRVEAAAGASANQAQFDAMLEQAGRSGKLGEYFNRALGAAARNVGFGGR